jgi:hypothetical protein
VSKTLKALAEAPDSVFRIWSLRQRIEIEAAGLFAQLGRDLTTLRGPDDEVKKMAEAASRDEYQHADLCQAILDEGTHSYNTVVTRANLNSAPPNQATYLGPLDATLENRVLYTCVALGCVTETLSTALLTDMRDKAETGIIKDTVHKILVDEISHSRIGWAELARASEERNLSWLAQFIPDMIGEALNTDIGPMLSREEKHLDLSRWGILSPARAHDLMNDTVNTVIRPGLKHFGIK